MSFPDRPYRVGFVGAGNISKLHLEGIARHPDRMQAAALCDVEAKALAARAAEFGVGRTYAGLDEMIARAELDVAVVCTPTHVRKQVILPLLEAGIPVFCEKPFAETYAEAAAVEARSRQLRVPVAINQNFRRHFSFLMAREVLARGGLGKPLHLTQVSMFLRRDTGWRLDRRRYVMAVMSIHWFDGYRFLLGKEPETVYCRGVNSPATEGGEDTGVSVILQFPDGVVANLSESFSCFAGTSFCVLDCEAGSLTLGYAKMVESRGPGQSIEHTNPFDKAEATYFLLDDLMRAREEARPPETSASDNLKSMRIMEAAYRSLTENRVVRIEEIQ